MEYTDYRQANEHLLRAAMVLAPNGRVQEKFSEIARSEADPGMAMVALMMALYEGAVDRVWPGEQGSRFVSATERTAT
jgi:hypothetical protein